jgi:hypothetical protein
MDATRMRDDDDGEPTAERVAAAYVGTAIDPMIALVDAFSALGWRGSGDEAWALPFEVNPIAFLLDTVADAIILREEGGAVVYRNRAAASLDAGARPAVPAEEFRVGSHRYERRCVTVDRGSHRFVLEIVHEVWQRDE